MRKRITIGIILLLNVINGFTQNDTIAQLHLSLLEAQNYALQFNKDIQNKNLDIEIAKKKVWETTAIGLPQVTLNAAWQYIFEVPTMKIGSMGLDPTNPTVPVYNTPDDPASGINYVTPNFQYNEMQLELGSKSSTNYDITVSQLIFSGEYIVGLQASKVYKSLSQKNLEKTEKNIKETVAQSYYLVLVINENKKIIDSSYNNISRIQDEMIAMHKAGFIEETDVDQIKLTTLNIKTVLNSLNKQYDVAQKLLKLQLGLDFSKQVILTEQLKEILFKINFDSINNKNFDATYNSDFQLLETQENLYKLNLKLERSAYLPTIAAYYRHQEQINAPEFNFQPKDVIGVQASWKLWTSGSRHTKIQQRKMELEQIQNTKEQVQQSLTIDYFQSLSDFQIAQEKLLNEEESMNLAEKIYNRNLIKYKEGVASSLELTQAQNQFLTAQSNYFKAMVELLNSKAKMDKILR